MRTVTVWCADWPVVAAGASPDRPAAVLFANRVVARTRAAAAAGVKVGDRRRQAQRACPQLDILDHDPQRDARRFEPIVRAIGEMVPRLEVVEPGWVSFPARGPSRYFGGDRSMADQLIERCVVGAGPYTSLQIGVGVADGRVASAIAARLGSRRPGGVLVIEPGGSNDFLAPLPIAWLQHLGEASADLVDVFIRLGLMRCGDLAALAASEVMARFGAEGLHAHRLATGDDTRAPLLNDPSVDRRVEHRFDEPIEQMETVVFIAKRLADGLVETLSGDGRVCTRLVVEFESEPGERDERVWYRDRGLTAAAMVERVRWQLDGWVSGLDGPGGGVVAVRLDPVEVRADGGYQGGLWGGRTQADGDAARAVARLSGLAGERAVCVAEWVGGRLPAERYRWVPAAESDLDDPSARLDPGDGVWPGAVQAPAPTTVFDQPIAIELLDRSGRPVAVSGRGSISAAPHTMVEQYRRTQVVAWAGPWPLEQRWWDVDRARRLARLQVVTDSGTAHLVAVEGGEWSLLATYA